MQLCHDGLKKISSDHSFFFCIWLTKTSNQIDKKKTIHISKTNNSDKIIISLLGTEFSDMSPFSFILRFIICTVILGTTGWKLNYRKKVIFITLNFLPLEFLLIKKLKNLKKTKTTLYTTFKTDITKVVLVFLISNFFNNKKSQGRKLSVI